MFDILGWMTFWIPIHAEWAISLKRSRSDKYMNVIIIVSWALRSQYCPIDWFHVHFAIYFHSCRYTLTFIGAMIVPVWSSGNVCTLCTIGSWFDSFSFFISHYRLLYLFWLLQASFTNVTSLESGSRILATEWYYSTTMPTPSLTSSPIQP